MISFRENFFGNEMNAIKKKQEEQKKKMMAMQQNIKEKAESGKKLGSEIKVKVEDWIRGKKGKKKQAERQILNLEKSSRSG